MVIGADKVRGRGAYWLLLSDFLFVIFCFVIFFNLKHQISLPAAGNKE
jgi:hypothetical protein